MVTAEKNGTGKTFVTQASLNSEVKSICDIMRRSNCAGALQYVPELTWILFLRILDEHETQEAAAAEAFGTPYTPSLSDALPLAGLGRARKGRSARNSATAGTSIKTWINTDLLPHLRELEQQTDATPRQKVISEVMSGVERVRIDTDKQPARRARQGERHQQRGRGRDAHLHPVAGLRGPAAEDGREGQRRRAVLHAARGDPRHGAGHRARRSAKPSTTPAAEPAAFWRRRTTSCARHRATT